MRKALVPAAVLVVAAIVLGSTVFREQIAHAATTPFQQVLVQNTSTNPVPVTQIGTSTTSVTGTVGIDPSKNTVKLDTNGNTVNLDSTDAANLANAVTDLGNLKFDSSGSLETTAPQTASPSPLTQVCTDGGEGSSLRTVEYNSDSTGMCGGSFYVYDISASGMDDNIVVDLEYDGNVVYELRGGNADGTDKYQIDLSHPIRVDSVYEDCHNGFPSYCRFSLALLGNSTGS
jgi:hypothetical protein